ncbi:cache domain-containing protein [Actinokineospora sp. HUAS TT18]|uniref:cache domain-containing protein n=1 Tax=Actinokineospora sp. HUAS TT18 TaxID=3447451 RepID=UPI003F51BDDE
MTVGLLLLAAVAYLLLGTGRDTGAPEAAVRSHEQSARNAGTAISAAAGQRATDLRTLAAVAPAQPDVLLDALLRNRTWRGAAVLDANTRALLGVRGEPVPVEAVPDGLADATVVPVVEGPAGPRLVAAAPLPGNRVLVAVSLVRLPRQGAGGTLLLVDDAGRRIDTAGAPLDPADTERATLVAEASAAAARGETGSVRGAAHGTDTPQTVVAYAPATAGAAHFGVLAVAAIPVAALPTGLLRLAVTGSLVLLAVLVFVLLRLGLVNPVRRLRTDALAVAGGTLTRPVRVPGGAEPRRIALAVEHARTALGGPPRESRRVMRGAWWKSPRLVVVTCAVLVIGWAASVVVVVVRHQVPVPQSVADGARGQTTQVAFALRRGLGDGLADLSTVGRLADASSVDLRKVVDGLADRQRYRSVYVVERDGAISAHAGRPALRGAGRPEQPGIGAHDAGRVPVLYAAAALADGRTLVGEFDLDYLGALLSRGPGRVRLVDAQSRTIAANGGFVAFERVAEGAARSGLDAARAGGTIVAVHPDAVVAAGSLRGGAVGALGWQVLSEQPVDELALPGNEVRRGALMAALVTLILGLLLLGWHYFVHIRPLRAVAEAADRVRAGAGDVIFPRHHDEIGTLACCLEVCRQAMADGRDRLGGVRRSAGSATDVTELIARVPASAGGVR